MRERNKINVRPTKFIGGDAKGKWRCDYRDQASYVDACALIQSKIQLNYFAIAARPGIMLVSDIYEIRNPSRNLFVSALLLAFLSYYVEIYSNTTARLTAANCYLNPNDDDAGADMLHSCHLFSQLDLCSHDYNFCLF